MMRINPSKKYQNMPCSYVSVGCAFEDITGQTFKTNLPSKLKADGYLSLDEMNKFIRKHLTVRKKKYFPQKDRMSLRDFLRDNDDRCLICVIGHFFVRRLFSLHLFL